MCAVWHSPVLFAWIEYVEYEKEGERENEIKSKGKSVNPVLANQI